MKDKNKFFLGSIIVIFTLIIINWNRIFIAQPQLEEINAFKIKRDNTSIYIPTIYRGDCKIMSIDSLKNFSSFNNFTNGVPRVLHYVSNEEDIPKTYTEMYKNCGKLNKDMMLVLWTDASFYKVFVTQFDKNIVEKWKTIFSNLDDPIRTSMIRMMVLYVFGGVSLSLDTICQKSIKDAFNKNEKNKNTCFVSAGNNLKANIEFDVENEFGESVMGCIAHHPFYRFLIDNKISLKLDRMYFTNYLKYYNGLKDISQVNVLDLKISDQVLPVVVMERICKRNAVGIKRNSACKSLNKSSVVNSSMAMMLHVPSYGVSSVQIIADDVCSAGIPVHIVIV